MNREMREMKERKDMRDTKCDNGHRRKVFNSLSKVYCFIIAQRRLLYVVTTKIVFDPANFGVSLLSLFEEHLIIVV